MSARGVEKMKNVAAMMTDVTTYFRNRNLASKSIERTATSSFSSGLTGDRSVCSTSTVQFISFARQPWLLLADHHQRCY